MKLPKWFADNQKEQYNMLIRFYHRPMLSADRCATGGPANPEGRNFKSEFAKPGRPEVIRRVLIVDDDRRVLEETSRELLTYYKFPFVAVVDPVKLIGPQVFSLVREFKPDLIVLDGNMPDVTGEQLTKDLRSPTRLNYNGYIAANTADRLMQDMMMSAGADFKVPRKYFIEFLHQVLI
jgi:CheY-like chemotaxis protein